MQMRAGDWRRAEHLLRSEGEVWRDCYLPRYSISRRGWIQRWRGMLGRREDARRRAIVSNIERIEEVGGEAATEVFAGSFHDDERPLRFRGHI